jgi:hypothetical protein
MAAAARLDFELRAGRAMVPAGAAPAALRDFVARANAGRHIEGLPDEMNPSLLDADKVVHLAANLQRLPPATLAKLAGHDLYLDDPGLQVHAAFPSHAENFDAGFHLDIAEIQGKTVLARVDLPPDLGLARERARNAALRFGALSDDVAQLENAKPVDIGALRLAKERRLAAARYWRMNARAWAQAAPGDSAAASAAGAADAAARAAAIAPRAGTVPENRR